MRSALRIPQKIIAKISQTRLLRLPQGKSISVMMRIKNEEIHIRAAVLSIVDLVDEIVIVDNQSDDRTPEIIGLLEREYPGKVVRYQYPYSIARVGSENQKAAVKTSAEQNPGLLSVYYNWCLDRCTKNYVLKWDGDMIATPAFGEAISAFRASKIRHVLRFRGVNIHPSGDSVIAVDEIGLHEAVYKTPTSTSSEKADFDTIRTNWLAPMTEYEPRLFPRLDAVYDNGFWWCERLSSPYTEGLQASLVKMVWQEPCYLHMKYCKPDPFSNLSEEFRHIITRGMRKGRKLDNEDAQMLSRFFLL